MNIRTKLLLCFFGFSTLIIIVGLIFYTQLKNLIEPLTPQSIPQSIEQLDKGIDKNNFVFRLLYQQQLTEFTLEDYVLTNRISSLQAYYMNEGILQQLYQRSFEVDAKMGKELNWQYQIITKKWADVLLAMKANNFDTAKDLLLARDYSESTQKIKNMLQLYTQDYDVATNEKAVVTVKNATKNTINILRDSLNATILIFFNAIVISILLTYFADRTISYPINELRNEMESVDVENMNVPIPSHLLRLKGEIGALARSFVTLIDKLRSTMVSRNQLLKEVERRMKSEKELRKTAAELQTSNRELDRFAYAVSHDLRTPLRGIETLSQWIIEDCQDILPEDSRQHLGLLKNRARRLEMLINGILDYSRAGKKENIESVNLNKLLNEVVDNLAPPKNIKISIDIHMPTIKTLKAALTQVFLNLINNAVKFNDKSLGKINVGYEELQDYYQFYVADNGPGIAPQFHEKIFQIFQTLQPRDTIESAGIGLALVEKIVEQRGGKIWLTSKLTEGTVFYFTWPKKPVESAEESS